LTGGKVEPLIALDVLLYSYSMAFHINPYEAKDVPMSFLGKMLGIHGVIKELEAEELKKIRR